MWLWGNKVPSCSWSDLNNAMKTIQLAFWVLNQNRISVFAIWFNPQKLCDIWNVTNLIMHSICPFHNGNREAPKLPSDIQDAGILKTDVPRCNHSAIRHQTVFYKIRCINDLVGTLCYPAFEEWCRLFKCKYIAYGVLQSVVWRINAYMLTWGRHDNSWNVHLLNRCERLT